MSNLRRDQMVSKGLGLGGFEAFIEAAIGLESFRFFPPFFFFMLVAMDLAVIFAIASVGL